MDTHSDTIRAFYADLWDRQDRSGISEILTEDVNFRGSLGAEKTGHDGFWSYVLDVTGPLGDYRSDIEEIVDDRESAAARMEFSGVHRDTFRGYPATGNRVSWKGAAFFRFAADGRISRLWVLGDLINLEASLKENQRRAEDTP